MTLPLAISTGDPGGVGPEIALAVALETRHDDPPVLFGDATWLARRARSLAGDDVCLVFDRDASALVPPLGKVGLVHVAGWSAEALEHRATPAGGAAQLQALDGAIEAARAGRVRGLVTAPMSKSAVHHAGYDFVGHTEHLARVCGLADDDVTMLFLGPRLRVGLVTTHVSIANAPSEITPPRVLRTILHLGEALVRVADPRAQRLRMAVSGLNPHAGEDGMFGDEEPRLIAPAIEQARAKAPFANGQVVLEGPIGAETAFRNAASGTLDAVVAMLHDQATIASKLLDWGDAVNTTWGLPFVRTSVDHGVAYDAAESGKIQVDGMRAAFRMAQRLTR
jgi:4-hydroxythreonine-4-phosphate dehydrogenase